MLNFPLSFNSLSIYKIHLMYDHHKFGKWQQGTENHTTHLINRY